MDVQLCGGDEVPPGQMRQFTIDGVEVLIGRSEDGRLFATCGTCPHRGAQLGGGTLDGTIVTCPWHEWSFDLSDGCGITNPQSELECYPISEINGQIVVKLPE